MDTSIVRFFSEENRVLGSGFLISENQVITCFHLINQYCARTIRDPLNSSTNIIKFDFPLIAPGEILRAKFDNTKDLAHQKDVAVLLIVDQVPKEAQPIKLVSVTNIWGHSFRAFGFPSGHDNGVWTSGILRGKQATGWILIEDVKSVGYKIEPGFSGAPVWDDNINAVVGMIVASEGDPDVRVAYMVPTEVLINSNESFQQFVIPICPYRGLYSFREEDAGNFFGREEFVDQLVETVKTKAIVVIIGPSGIGKSSVVFAGMIPAVKKDNQRIIIDFRPGFQPFSSLAAALLPYFDPSPNETDGLIATQKLAGLLISGQINLADIIIRILVKHRNKSQVLIIIDQFEELFMLSSESSLHLAFISCLFDAVNKLKNLGPAQLSLVNTLRADFLGSALAFRIFSDAIQDANLVLGPMTLDELQRVIRLPAEKLKVSFETGLIQRILNDLKEGKGNLPLLEFALTKMWEYQENFRITHAIYEKIGGVNGALAQYAEEIYQRLNQNEKKLLKHVLTQMVQPGERTDDTKRLATRMEIGEEGWDLSCRMANARLLVTNWDPSGIEVGELVHESLIKGWSRLRIWMEEDRDFRIWQERLRASISQWKTAGCDDGSLLYGTVLNEAETWLQERELDLGSQEIDFIKKSIDQVRLDSALDVSPEPYVVVDRTGIITYANPASEVILTGKSREARGKPAYNWITEPSVLNLLTATDNEGKSVEIITKSRAVYIAQISEVVKNGNLIARVCLLTNITIWKELDVLKSDFVATVSHDLRSPLTLMRGYATMLQMVGDLNEQQKGYVRKIISGVENMSRLVNNLLDLGRIEAGIALQIDRVMVNAISEEVCNSLQLQAVQKDIRITQELINHGRDLVIEADRTLIQQALFNLVENAIKYTPVGGLVKVCLVNRPNSLVIEVHDTGIGIAPLDLPHLFEKFYRSSRREAYQQRGTGLGLATVKSIVERHGGRVWVDSQLGKGSVFSLEIPHKQTRKV